VKALPVFAVDLVNELNASYPERSARLGENIDEIMFKAGQRSVVQSLLARLELVNEIQETLEQALVRG